MKLDTQKQVDAAERILRLAWVIVFGAVLYSVLTVTPLTLRVTPPGWGLTAPILPIVVDAAVVIAVRVDAIVARLDGHAGFWPALLRWLTGLMTLALNVGDSALKGDLVGVSVHAVAPLLLIVTSEAALKWRRAITAAIARIERERADAHEALTAAHERSRAAHEASRREQEAAARREREEAEEARRRAEREDREHAARLAREEREHAAQLAREVAEREAARLAREADRERQLRADEQARADRERERAEAAQRGEAEAEAAERKRAEAEADQARERLRERLRERERADREQARADVSADEQPPEREDRMGEDQARETVALGLSEGATQRQMVEATGWSAGWVATRCKELREQVAA